MDHPIHVGARLDNVPLGRFHYRMLGLIGAGMFFDSFDVYMAGAILAALLHSGESTLSQNASFVSATFLGMMVGAWLAGVLGDRFGRRFTYQLNLAVYGLASIAAAFAPTIQWLIVLRLVMGLGLGAELVVGYGALSEFIPAQFRGRFGATLNFINNIALVFSTFLGWLIIPYFGWRCLFAIAGVGAMIIWILRKSMPESPRWLAAKGRTAEAEATLREIEGDAQGGTQAEGLSSRVSQGVAPDPTPVPLRELFSSRMLGRTVTGIVVLVVFLGTYYAFVSWMPTFLLKQGHSFSNSLVLTTLMFTGAPVGSLIAYALADRIGRKWGIVLFSLLAILFWVVYPFAQTRPLIVALGFAITCCICVLSSLSMGSYIPELFPTSLRLRGSGLCNTFGRGFNIFMPYIVTSSFVSFGIVGVIALICAMLMLQALVVATIGVETRSRSLEDIGESAKDVSAAASLAESTR
ncbi:MAG TPA: MFS transporter [Paraburkholderia sp.]|nr:MFS transporter [Paraburkholderia sp.]